jgi:hypothetical protein
MRNTGFGLILFLSLLPASYAADSEVRKPLKVSNGGIEGKVVMGPVSGREKGPTMP